LNDPFVLTVSLLIGLVFGSFISMLSWRLPRILELDGREQLKAISLGGSECPHCRNTLPWYRLFPLLSWLISKGRCHACKTPISARYPLIELSTGLLTLLSVWHFGLSWHTLWVVAFCYWLITISVIDFEHHLILDKLSLTLLWLGLLLNAFHQFVPAKEAILGAITGYLILWILFQAHFQITGKEGMGYGDFKLTAALGAWLGVYALPQILLLSALSAILIFLLLILLRKQDWQASLPFGPYLAIGGLITLFAGDSLLIRLLS
jgi:leader peptidase (prepilin peptidase)/N-methyltransferase